MGDLVRPLFEHYQETTPVNTILVRADSGFATPDLYKVCEEFQIFYVIRLKSNRNLGKIAEQFIFIDDNHDWTKKEVRYISTIYQAKSWKKPRRLFIKSTREAKNEFYFDKTDSPRFLENHARMMLSLLAYNIINFMRILCFTKEIKGFQVSTIRLFLF